MFVNASQYALLLPLLLSFALQNECGESWSWRKWRKQRKLELEKAEKVKKAEKPGAVEFKAYIEESKRVESYAKGRERERRGV